MQTWQVAWFLLKLSHLLLYANYTQPTMLNVIPIMLHVHCSKGSLYIMLIFMPIIYYMITARFIYNFNVLFLITRSAQLVFKVLCFNFYLAIMLAIQDAVLLFLMYLFFIMLMRKLMPHFVPSCGLIAILLQKYSLRLLYSHCHQASQHNTYCCQRLIMLKITLA